MPSSYSRYLVFYTVHPGTMRIERILSSSLSDLKNRSENVTG
jgi:hypothetical protein